MTTRLSFEDQASLKTDTDLLLALFGTQTAAAEFTRVKQGQLSDYRHPFNLESFIAVDVLADLLKAKRGSDYVLRKLAKTAGFMLIPLPEGEGAASILRGSGEMAEDLGQVLAEIGHSLHDGKLTQDEARAIIAKIMALIVSAYALAKQVEAEAAE